MYRRQEVVLLIVEHVVAHRHAGSDEFGYATLHESLRKLRVLQLVAYRHTPASPDELGQVGVERMIGKARHLRSLTSVARASVAAPRESDAEYLRRSYGILAVSLVEVTAAEQQQCVGMLRLEVEKLFHHRREAVIFLFCRHVVVWFFNTQN